MEEKDIYLRSEDKLQGRKGKRDSRKFNKMH